MKRGSPSLGETLVDSDAAPAHEGRARFRSWTRFS